MIRYRFPLLIAVWVTCLSFSPANHQSLKTSSLLSSSWQSEGKVSQEIFIAQTTEPKKEKKDKLKTLKPGYKGNKVKDLQKKLKELGYFEGEIDGDYGEATKLAVSKFQESQGIKPDGIAGNNTRQKLKAAWEKKYGKKTPEKKSGKEKAKAKSKISRTKLLLLAVGGVSLLGFLIAMALFILRLRKGSEDYEEDEDFLEEDEIEEDEELLEQEDYPESQNNGNGEGELHAAPKSQKALEIKKTPPSLPKVDIVEELILDLRRQDRTKRRKAIWELAQRGDSRAVKPLSELIIESDSQQRGLILEALSQISSRTLKPVNRALAISLQDDNPEVRKNALRDLTKIYEMIYQMSNFLQVAMDDPDPEVRETAQWAAQQVNKLRVMSGNFDMPNFSASRSSLGKHPEE